MNRRVFVVAVVAAASLIAAPVAARDFDVAQADSALTGTWEITSEGRRGPQTSTLTLVQSDSVLTGTMTMRMGGRRGGGGGGGGGGAMESEITDGSVTGNSFTFTIVLNFNGNTIERVYTGTFEGDSMQGSVEGGGRGGRGGGAQPFTGERGG